MEREVRLQQALNGAYPGRFASRRLADAPDLLAASESVWADVFAPPLYWPEEDDWELWDYAHLNPATPRPWTPVGPAGPFHGDRECGAGGCALSPVVSAAARHCYP